MSQTTTRLAQLTQLSCKVFSNVYNPTCARTGNKIVRQRLIGSSLTSYNPQKLVHFRDIQALYPQLGLVNLEEKERLDEIARRKRRGKGAPKKGKFVYIVITKYPCLLIVLKNRSRQACFKQKEMMKSTIDNNQFVYTYSNKKKSNFQRLKKKNFISLICNF
jgi:hypothetical protein